MKMGTKIRIRRKKKIMGTKDCGIIIIKKGISNNLVNSLRIHNNSKKKAEEFVNKPENNGIKQDNKDNKQEINRIRQDNNLIKQDNKQIKQDNKQISFVNSFNSNSNKYVYKLLIS